MNPTKHSIIITAAVTATFALTATTNAAVITTTIDLSGATSNDVLGSPVNTILDTFIGANSALIGLSWDVTVSTIGDSWLSEIAMSFADIDGLNIIFDDDHEFSGTESYLLGGIMDLSRFNPHVGADGLFTIEFYELLTNNGGAGDALYESGSTLTLIYETVPAPAATTLLGLAGCAGVSRRRRSHTVAFFTQTDARREG